MTSPIQPALNAVAELRREITKRFGGSLQHRLLLQLDTVEATLLQLPDIPAVVKALNAQTAQSLAYARRSQERRQP